MVLTLFMEIAVAGGKLCKQATHNEKTWLSQTHRQQIAPIGSFQNLVLSLPQLYQKQLHWC